MNLSTDHNLNHPMEVNWIDILPNIDMWTSRIVKQITRTEYDHLATKDPNTMYVVTHRGGTSLYLGDRLYDPMNHEKLNRYFIGMNDRGEFVLYQRYTANGGDKLIPICRVEGADDAFDLLSRALIIDPVHERKRVIYMQLIAYAKGEIDTNNFILGIISTMGYREHPGLQRVIELTSIETDASLYELPPSLTRWLHSITDVGEIIAGYYLKIYDVLVRYNFLRDVRDCEDLEAGITDLTAQVSNILAVFK